MSRLPCPVFTIAIFVLSSAVLSEPFPKLCEVVTDEYGTTELVPCCDITGLVYTDERRVGRIYDAAEVAKDPECEEAEKEIRKDSLQVLEQVLRSQTTKSIARFLRANPQALNRDFVIEPPIYNFTQLCCTCTPGKTCSEDIFAVCGFPNDDGTCPTGTLRTICSFGSFPSSDTCDSID